MSVGDFADWFPHTVTVEPVSGRDGFGQPTYGAAVSYQARIVGKSHFMRDTVGQERTARFKVYVNTNSIIDPASRVTLPNTYNPTQPAIMAVESFPDEDGDHHTVLLLG